MRSDQFQTDDNKNMDAAIYINMSTQTCLVSCFHLPWALNCKTLFQKKKELFPLHLHFETVLNLAYKHIEHFSNFFHIMFCLLTVLT